MSKTVFPLSNVNEAIRNNKFPDSLKLSDITLVYKKLDPNYKAIYRPVSVLPILSKVFEKIIYDQLYEYMENFLSECSLQDASDLFILFYFNLFIVDNFR